MSRRAITELLVRSKLDLYASRDACAERAGAEQRRASGACRGARAEVLRAKGERTEAYQEARGSFGRARRACQPSVAAARAAAPKGQKRAAGKAASTACRRGARDEESQRYGRYRRARAKHETARATRKTTCEAARGVGRQVFAECIEPALSKHADERRRADMLEADRRASAKLARGGRRQPVSPAERDEEEIGRARADLEAADEGARALFEERPRWFLRQWHKARKGGRRLTLAEFVVWVAHEDPEAADEARERASEAWVAEQWEKYLREAA